MDAYFAGGCFWCMAKPYNTVKGVLKVESGYCGGNEEDAVYERVKKQLTAHRETVHIEFDPEKITFDELLQVYFYNIDSFDGGGQFIDRGRSYTCAVYYTDDAQKTTAESAIKKIEEEYRKTVFVSVEKFMSFYRAEEYHQDYALKNTEAYKKEFEDSGRAAVKEEDRVKI